MNKTWVSGPGPFLQSIGSNLPFRRGVRCGEMVWTSGQLAMADSITTRPLYAGDMPRQTRVVMENLKALLGELGATMDDVLKLTTYYVGLDGWRESVEIQAEYFNDGPAFTGVGVPALMEPGLMIQVDAVAMVGGKKTFVDPPGHHSPVPASPFHHGVRQGNVIYASGQRAVDDEGHVLGPDDMLAQTRQAMENLKTVLAAGGASMDDVVKTNAYYFGLDDWGGVLKVRGGYFREGPTSTGIVLARPTPGLTIEMDAVAIVNEARTFTKPADYYPIPFNPPFRHGVKCGNLVYVAGQVAYDLSGRLLYRDDLERQTHITMENIRRVLGAFGASMDDVVKINTYFIGLEGWRESLVAQGAYFTEGPCISAVGLDDGPIPGFGDRVEIEAIAVLGD